MTRRRIAIVTGSRAEYGLLYWPIRDLLAASDFELQLIVTGMHLSPEFGLTVRDIERDGTPISARVDMLVSSDTPGGIAKSMALGLIGFSDAIERLRPDAMLVLGDRFEILAAAQAAMVHNVPLVHIAGGDTTEGAFDEAIRHAITKMAHLHLVTNEAARQRVVQMGEDPRCVHIVGSPGLDHLRRQQLLDHAALETSLGQPLGARNALVTFHPVTLEPADGLRQQEELLAALEALPEEWVLWFTLPNADTGGRGLAAALQAWAKGRARVRVFASLGQLRYLSLMREADVVVGNSSSGLYEAPSFQVPTIDIGDRQRGRLAAASVLHCEPERGAIREAINRALALDCSGVQNPYGDGRSAARIVDALRAMPPAQSMLKKTFHMIEAARA
ncbi:UDP-N-acetylglucosamine 2-epimerase (hydrolyzing) [Chromobacterium phragmitis]|uniref:UDP-N-acetylglucosamine 2-epimerase n=1 Tax=Chromobacterium phragmitis TaxID=2202141 RepID=UPI000DEC6EBB|nr:UDP-N-acetylglucosamine 2-epimerase [Chromobacterium phragmitis]AXE30451.1 UDP-N-acetylglucosamine 2-epimerase (hydrolyzing) [Chromobacterium phragmitis]